MKKVYIACAVVFFVLQLPFFTLGLLANLVVRGVQVGWALADGARNYVDLSL